MYWINLEVLWNYRNDTKSMMEHLWPSKFWHVLCLYIQVTSLSVDANWGHASIDWQIKLSFPHNSFPLNLFTPDPICMLQWDISSIGIKRVVQIPFVVSAFRNMIIFNIYFVQYHHFCNLNYMNTKKLTYEESGVIRCTKSKKCNVSNMDQFMQYLCSIWYTRINWFVS